MKNFNWEDFKNGKIYVHCDTEEKAKDFIKKALENHCRWVSGNVLKTYFNVNKEETCYISIGNLLHHAELNDRVNQEYPVIKWEIKEDNMERTFREIIPIGKFGQVWIGKHFKIEFVKNDEIEIKTLDGNDIDSHGIHLDGKFKLQRKEYTFEEAFKEYENGEEIESRVSGLRYRKTDNGVDCCYNKSLKNWFVNTNNISIDEIRGKWYINRR